MGPPTPRRQQRPEIGAIAHALGLDSWKVMDVFLSDTKLNISPAYLPPGFAFGGSCLPKDLRGLVYAARRADVDVPVLENVLESNEAHLKRSSDLIAGTGKRKIGLFGLSFNDGVPRRLAGSLADVSRVYVTSLDGRAVALLDVGR